jgi:hypothetical protein
MTKYDQFARRVIDITGSDARILIADDIPGEKITNMLVPSIFIRYFMMYYSVGSQYTKPTSSLYDYAKENNSDYILLLSYANSFDHCEELLTAEHDYLIDISEESIPLETEECFLSSFDIYDLGEALR